MHNFDVPPLSECFHCVNLTNGLEAVPHLRQLQLPYSVSRIQSTYCEQAKWDELIIETDPNLLLSLATGNCCLVWDFGSRNRKRGVPRAIWYGLEFLRYAATQSWLSDVVDTPPEAFLRGVRVTSQFDAIIRGLGKTAKKCALKLRYYKKMVPSGVTSVRLFGVFDDTAHDADAHVYQTIVSAYMGPTSKLDDPYIAPELAAYIQPRVPEDADLERLLYGDAVTALDSLGFDMFFGGHNSNGRREDEFEF